ncbi:MAG: hypothetical protein O2854_09135 [Chloroflexi bacterium]|nr:hypothetical protein [Chloroflexota bacterium]
MNDTILIIGGVLAIVFLLGGGGWLMRKMFNLGKHAADSTGALKTAAAPVKDSPRYES